MRKVIILHRWGGTPQNDWYQWLKSELENKGYEVSIPQAPNTDNPIISERMEFMNGVMTSADEDTIFVCHSIGCQTLMRWLAVHDQKIGKAIFVAGWLCLENLENEEVEIAAKQWLDTPIDFGVVKEKIGELDVFLSDNEPFGYVAENREIFEQKLGATVTILPNKGHFIAEDGVTELPEILALF